MTELDFTKFKAVTFDVYGTLIDWETALPRIIQPWLVESGVNVTDELVLSAFAANQKKHQLVRPALLYTELLRLAYLDLEGSFGLKPNEARAVQFSRSVGEWGVFEDTVEALRQFNKTCAIEILSNVDNALFERTRPRLGVPITIKVTAEDVKSYKPDLPHFAESFRQAAALGIKRSEILHVAWSKHHDMEPCRNLGIPGVWIDRRHNKLGPGATIPSAIKPDWTFNSLAELASVHKSQTE